MNIKLKILLIITLILAIVVLASQLLVPKTTKKPQSEVPAEYSRGGTPLQPDTPVVKNPAPKTFIDRLPLTNPHYYVEYDYSQETIIASIFTIPSPSISKDDQIEFLKKEVSKKLVEIGVDLDKDKIIWRIE